MVVQWFRVEACYAVLFFVSFPSFVVVVVVVVVVVFLCE